MKHTGSKECRRYLKHIAAPPPTQPSPELHTERITMTHVELASQRKALDYMLGDEPFTSPRGSVELASMRALVEIAFQISALNERLADASNPIPVALCSSNDDIRVRLIEL